MTLASITGERLADWSEAIRTFGWACDVRFVDAASGQVRIRAFRGSGPSPRVTLDVRERWALGSDPDGLGLEAHGCHLHLAAWHAQLPGSPGPVHAHRLDVSRGKAPALMIHLHPHGSPNGVRVGRSRIGAPAQWIAEVEELCWAASGYWT